MTRVFLIAGEPSGDALGAALMSGLRSLEPGVSFDGIGGPEMEAQGLVSRFPMSDLTVMGLAEVLPRYPALRRRLRQAVKAVLDTRPDVLITIDSPDFCLRVARAVRARARIRTVHYVAPTIWAWRPRRAARMKGVIDQVLALFPFEPPHWAASGIRCDFVGHPVAATPPATEAQAAAFRLAHGIGDAPLLLALPGSRRSEVARLAPVMDDALERLRPRHPDMRVVIPAAPSVIGTVTEACSGWAVRPLILDPREIGAERLAEAKHAAFRAADVALAASGSVTLELAAAGTPMVVAYDLHPLSRAIVTRLLKVDTVTLPNLVTGTRAVPEFIGRACRPVSIAGALAEVIDHPRHQMAALAECMERLGQGGEHPGLRAARAVLSGLGRG
ncbi:lipid-A-disaccharide synthase [Oceanicola sp. 22II-s10i]|uniref:lipid-A-disaccharide synthase n=1 Tax=Oceanicola sp. 22II-s10i TaxID=1317116 RepID=UPI000B526D90|nr:lipid-A-disaccharide synthase [Oceanicola sp. 22II-s10i]OWU83582.1 lipid-A-disaccharide synthase [Oceanicola sp. 22II-s10i]